MIVPRVVVVTRPTELEAALARHGTAGQVRFFLEQRGQSLAQLRERQGSQDEAVRLVLGSVPAEWRRVRVARADLPTFLFEPEDIVVPIGQDGLVANVARYVDGQVVIGVNPDPDRYDGVLVRHGLGSLGQVMVAASDRLLECEERTMVVAHVDDGQDLLALNEIYVGHRTHQSARYVLTWNGLVERQSSSGVIVATGTGATGWARSISGERHSTLSLPAPEDARLVFFSREPFPSVATGTTLTEGLVEKGARLTVECELTEGGVVFGDGIESDGIDLAWGQRVAIERADQVLRLG